MLQLSVPDGDGVEGAVLDRPREAAALDHVDARGVREHAANRAAVADDEHRLAGMVARDLVHGCDDALGQLVVGLAALPASAGLAMPAHALGEPRLQLGP